MKYLSTNKFFVTLLTASSLTFATGTTIPLPSKKQISLEELKRKITKPGFNDNNFKSFEILNSRYASWGINASESNSPSINISEAWKKFESKKEVIVAVVDTGIDPTHPFLKDNLYSTSGNANSGNYGKDFSKDAQNMNQPIDVNGHGTHVSGIIKSVFPNVKILPLKYFNRSASGKDNLNSTIAALRFAVDSNVDIINYSGGGPEPDSAELEILKLAEKKGILVVAAAGNEESDIDKDKNAYFPASYKLSNIISVTAYNQNLQILSSSNYGKSTVDVAAPGYRIKSAIHSGGAGFLTGTSQATAFVSGVAALLKAQFPELTANQLKEIISKSAKKEITFAGKVKSEGRLDAAKAQELATQMTNTTDDRTKFADDNTQPLKRDLANSKKEGKIIFRVNK